MMKSALRRLQPVSLLATIVVVAACESPYSAAEPVSDPVANVVILQDSVVATKMYSDRDIVWMSFNLDESVTNDGEAPFSLNICASSVEQQLGGEWHKAWSPICAAVGGTNIWEIRPGETRRQVVTVTAALQGPAAPVWNGAKQGGGGDNIRFVAGILPAGLRGGSIPLAASNGVHFRLIDR